MLYMLYAASDSPRADIAHYVEAFPYNPVVFLLPPWEEIYATDSERDQTFDEATAVFEGMKHWYLQWGYVALDVPRATVEERVSFILQRLT